MKASRGVSLPVEMWIALERLNKEAYPTWTFSRLMNHVVAKGLNKLADEARQERANREREDKEALGNRDV